MQSRTSNLRYLTLTRLLLTFFISNWKYIHSPFFLPPHICLYIFVSEYLRCDRSVRFHLRIYDLTLDWTDKKPLKMCICSVGVDPWDSRVLSAAFRPRLRVLTLSFFCVRLRWDCILPFTEPSSSPTVLKKTQNITVKSKAHLFILHNSHTRMFPSALHAFKKEVKTVVKRWTPELRN